MKADYKNWVPNGMIYGFGAAAAGLSVAASMIKNKPLSALLGAGALGCGAFTAWCIYTNDQFSYDGRRNCPGRLLKELRNISPCRKAALVWMWAAAAAR